MAAHTARAPGYSGNYIYGSAVPAPREYSDQESWPSEAPLVRERRVAGERTSTRENESKGVSPFAVISALALCIISIFVLLAQINFTEVARETVRLNAQLRELNEQERILEITYESVIDMNKIEQYARDVLGMSQPDAGQAIVIHSTMQDRAEIISDDSRQGGLSGFGEFISTLTEYFRN